MYNLIKMDFYRLFRIKSFWIMILAAVGIAFFSAVMTNVDLEMMKEQPSPAVMQTEISKNGEVVAEFGIYTETNKEWVHGDIPFSELLDCSLRSGILLILCVIFVPLFVNGEYKSGYIKNIAGQLPFKGALVLSKISAAVVQIFVILAVFSAATGLAGVILWGQRFVPGSLQDFMVCFGLQFLLHFAFAIVAMFLTVLFKNSAISMVFGILCSMGISGILAGLVNHLLQSVDGLEKINLLKYLIEVNVQNVTASVGRETVIRMVLVGISYIVLAGALSIAVVQKRDI